jgi:hypothetical protein
MFQNYLNTIPTEMNSNKLATLQNGPKKQKISDTDNLPNWLTTSAVSAALKDDIKIMLLCGADMFETFIKPGLWKQEHVRTLCEMRANINFKKLIFLGGRNTWAVWCGCRA